MQDTKDIQTIQISLKILLQYSSVNGAEYVVGQENIYEDPCDDWLDLINKQITSPNYPKSYEPLTYCNWNLREKHGYFCNRVLHQGLDWKRLRTNIKIRVHGASSYN